MRPPPDYVPAHGLLRDKTVMVTAAAGAGIGFAVAKRCAEEGARALVVSDIHERRLAEAVTAIRRDTGLEAVHGQLCDVSKEDNVQALFAFAQKQMGHVDVLVNNAGGVLGQVGRPLEEVRPEEWQAIFDVNVTAAFHFAQAVAPGMKAAQFGRIINISSGAGLGISLTGIQAYASAKAAQIGLTRQLAHELGPWGITVNNVAPGFVRSNPSTERQWEAYGEARQRALVEGIALKRLGTVEDIAAGVLFFASESARWITGQVLSIDGGR